MKKLFYFLTVFSLVFASCNPLEEVNTQIDKISANNGGLANVTYTLSKDDYKKKVKEGGLELNKLYFSSIDEAKEKIPAFLASKYPSLGVIYKADGSIKEASSATITYDYYNPIMMEAYTVTPGDYSAIGLDSLVSSNDINKFFDYKFPNTPKGSIIDLTYKTNPVINNYKLTSADYTLVGNGKYNNFDIRAGKSDETEEARRVKIQKILLNNFPNAKVGTKYEVTYATYNGKAGEAKMTLVLNKSSNIKNYELTNADYTLVGNGKYNNFDIRAGKGEETEEARRVKIQKILLKNYPNAKSGDEFHITYAFYDGSAGKKIMYLKFNGSDYTITNSPSLPSYDVFAFALETVTDRFTYTTKWKAPFILANDDYETLGSKYGNLAGRNKDQVTESQRKIGVYLSQKHPFAAIDDFIAVQYKSYLGGGKTKTINVNFVYDGSKWNAIQDVISETLQFGHDGKKWVPDNTIKYTLTTADYELVGNGKYKNFDIRTRKAEETEEARRVKIQKILLNNFPNAKEKQKYLVSYNVYNGSAAVLTMKVIKKGNEYILDK